MVQSALLKRSKKACIKMGFGDLLIYYLAKKKNLIPSGMWGIAKKVAIPLCGKIFKRPLPCRAKGAPIRSFPHLLSGCQTEN